MNRKKFLKLTSMGSLGLSLIPNTLYSGVTNITNQEDHKLTILHTNDQHSRIEPFDNSYTKNPNQGGFARRASLIHSIRKKEKNVLLLDSGDIFQGTPYFNFFGGELELKLMSKIGYEASTMGNHEFDNGIDGFNNVLKHANFPFICSNYNFENTILDGKTQPYKILDKKGIKVGLYGLGVELNGLVGKKQYAETKYLDPVEIANHYENYLKKEKKCDIVICLSHLGYDYADNTNKISDLKLASKTLYTDIILGGHTHTFLTEPQVVENIIGKKILINQVGWAGLLLGRIDFFFDSNKNVKQISWKNQIIDNSINV